MAQCQEMKGRQTRINPPTALGPAGPHLYQKTKGLSSSVHPGAHQLVFHAEVS